VGLWAGGPGWAAAHSFWPASSPCAVAPHGQEHHRHVAGVSPVDERLRQVQRGEVGGLGLLRALMREGAEAWGRVEAMVGRAWCHVVRAHVRA